MDHKSPEFAEQARFALVGHDADGEWGYFLMK